MSLSSSVFWPVSGSSSVIELHLVAEQRDAPGAVLQVGREQLHRVAAHAEGATNEVLVAAPVVQGDEVGQQLSLRQRFAGLHGEGHGRVGLDRADAVDARHRGDDDHVVTLQQRAGGGVAHAVDLLVDRQFLLDVGVGARHVGFGLVVVVVGDEVLDRVVGEEAPKLAIELGGQRLVGGQHQRWALGALDHLGHGEGLAGAGDAEQHLVALVLAHARHQLGNGGGLVALRLQVRDDAEGDAALALLGARRPVRCEGALGAGHQRVRGQHRLLGEHGAGAVGALVRAGEQGIEARRHVGEVAGGRGGIAEGGEGGGGRASRLLDGSPSPSCRRHAFGMMWGGVRGGGSLDGGDSRQERRLRRLGETGRGRALGLRRAAGPFCRRGRRLAGLAARGARAGGGVARRRGGARFGGAGHGPSI